MSWPIGGVLFRRLFPITSLTIIHLCGPPGKLSPFLAIGMNDPCSTLDLAPNGGYLAIRITSDAGALLPHRFTLTCAMKAIGGLLSAALIDRSLHPDSRQRFVHRSPDLPQHN
ncbi:MAG: hypothetical protein CM15mP49_00860 [Actinomycetota bacterium]|nr:MAG: hypothetical protein CM15mP49_00860 [Actinomycetota bacterium]